jgi:hypothetical protein
LRKYDCVTLTSEHRRLDAGRKWWVTAAAVALLATGLAGGYGYALWSLGQQSREVAQRSAQIDAQAAELRRARAALESERVRILAWQEASQSEADIAKRQAAESASRLRTAWSHYQEQIAAIIADAREPLSLPPSQDTDPKIIGDCRSLVSARNAFRGALREVERNLDGDFDRLEQQTRDPVDPVRLRQA